MVPSSHFDEDGNGQLQLTEIRGVLEDAGLLPKNDEEWPEPGEIPGEIIFETDCFFTWQKKNVHHFFKNMVYPYYNMISQESHWICLFLAPIHMLEGPQSVLKNDDFLWYKTGLELKTSFFYDLFLWLVFYMAETNDDFLWYKLMIGHCRDLLIWDLLGWWMVG